MQDSHTIQIPDQFDAQAVTDLRPALEQVAEGRVGDVVLDMSRTSFMDSSGVGAIVFLFKRLAEGGRKLTLLGTGGQPAGLIRRLKMDRVIPIRPAVAGSVS